MDEDFLGFLFFFQLTVRLTNAYMLLFPVLGANRITACLNDDALKCLDSLAHLLVELLLHRMQMEGQVLTEADKETEWLLDRLRCGNVCLCDGYNH